MGRPQVNSCAGAAQYGFVSSIILPRFAYQE
jgi:hypothetical protein